MSIVQSAQPSYTSTLQTTAICAVSRDIRITIERYDGFFYDYSDGTFKAFGSIADPYVVLTEAPPASGSYGLLLTTTTWLDGNYSTDLYDHTVDPASPVSLSTNLITYVDGGAQAPTGSEVTRIDHNFGGVDNLQYVDDAGDPIEDADVYAFTQAAWDASAATIQAIDVTKTKTDGRWVDPFFLVPGSYTIVFKKPNFYGPNTKDIIVV